MVDRAVLLLRNVDPANRSLYRLLPSSGYPCNSGAPGTARPVAGDVGLRCFLFWRFGGGLLPVPDLARPAARRPGLDILGVLPVADSRIPFAIAGDHGAAPVGAV